MIIMDTCLSTSYLKQPKSTTTTMTHPTDLAPQRWASNTHTPGQMAGMTLTTPTLQWLAWPPSSLKACKPEPHPEHTTSIGYFITVNQISLTYDKFCHQSITWENRGVNIPLLIINKDKIRKKLIQLRYVENLKWLTVFLLFDMHNPFSGITCIYNVTF